MSDESQPLAGILYVDDEEKALKYFRLAFAPKFVVFTATSPAEGLEILARESDKIGIVLSDQRMPSARGSDFLGEVRERYPGTVRILTTAYSDLSDAIQAVNHGYIYQYVTKPWEIPELEMVLRRAADYSRVIAERNGLLAVKMTMLQRILCSDRVKWLLLHARSLDDGASFRRALAAMIRALPEEVEPTVAAGNLRRFEIGNLLRAEYGNASRCLDALAVADLPAALAAAFGPDAVSVEAPARIVVNAAATALAPQLFGLLTEPETPVASVALLNALVRAEGPLTVAAGPTEFRFDRAAETDSPEDVIEALVTKFAAFDTSRL